MAGNVMLMVEDAKSLVRFTIGKTTQPKPARPVLLAMHAKMESKCNATTAFTVMVGLNAFRASPATTVYLEVRDGSVSAAPQE